MDEARTSRASEEKCQATPFSDVQVTMQDLTRRL